MSRACFLCGLYAGGVRIRVADCLQLAWKDVICWVQEIDQNAALRVHKLLIGCKNDLRHEVAEAVVNVLQILLLSWLSCLFPLCS